eukprot:gene16292-18589_t
MVKVNTHYNPALLKIFDEILVNAADNKQRDSSMTSIVISVDRSAENVLTISVKNDGEGIPLKLHETENIYVPELIFGHLLTGSNFNDSQSRLTGGSHGYGAKLTNIFSNRFEVEAYDPSAGLQYSQQWTENMSKVSAPTLTNLGANAGNGYTKVTFQPDLKRFGLTGESKQATVALLDEFVKVFHRRALDIAACVAPTKVNFNYQRPSNDSIGSDKALSKTSNSSFPKIGSFQEYVQLFTPPAAEVTSSESEYASVSGEDILTAPTADGETMDEIIEPSRNAHIAYSKVSDRWEVAVGLSSTGNYENMSFVNNVWTVRGGSHVNLVTSQITKAIEKVLEKKGVTISGANIRNKLMVFVNSKIENPMFDGQTKDSLNSKPSTFGSTCTLSLQFLKEVTSQTGIVESLLEDFAIKEQNKLLLRPKAARKQLTDVPKLEDAHEAGGARSLECTLILTEGDSAKALAVAGLEVVGRETFGVMPLRGKVLNVRGATRSQTLKNAEFINLCKALGLDFNKSYANGLENEGLRYGKVMIMCDQDTDGSHIKGLVINLFHHFWPNLLSHEGFLQQFITPIVKTRSARGKEAQSFYSIPEFKEWQDARRAAAAGSDAVDGAEEGVTQPEKLENVSIKYYKGLGTNTAAEGREYFKALALHRKQFQALQSADAAAIDLAFNKDKAGHRKHWLTTQHDLSAYLDPHSSSVSYEEFINKELIHFSYADIQRSIPNVVDGLKPSQRKVLYGCFKKKLIKEEAKVVQIAGYIAEHTAYHHGEASLHSTIINMAQDFVGANNVPLLVASGQFGTRAQGGKDFASPRYVFTRLSPVTRLLFPEEDDSFLKYEEEDGQTVEPTYFVPVIPTLLLNGSHGIGTGWSTSVPTFHLPHVVDQVRHKLLGTVPETPLVPHVVGFKGRIEPVQESNTNTESLQYRSYGIVTRPSSARLVITELPCYVWTDDYKNFLIAMVERGEIKEFKEFHSTDSVRFEILASKAQLDSYEKKGFHTVFKLTSSFSLNNMHAFDRHGKICRFANTAEIIDAHFDVRYAAYATRKAALERLYAAEELRARNKSQFIAQILSGEIQLFVARDPTASTGIVARTASRSNEDIVQDLRSRGFNTEEEIRQVQDGTTILPDNGDKKQQEGSYAYLLDLPIFSLTDKRSQQLQSRAQEAAEKLTQMKARSVQDLWLADLDRISSAYASIMKKEK